MTEQDFQTYVSRSKVNYAKDKVRANGLTELEANEIAERDFLRLLPKGRDTPGNLLFSIKFDSDFSVGSLWISVKGPQNSRQAFVYDVFVGEEFRGRGIGREAMLLAEQEVKKLGLTEIGLHVFGFNEVAINLYKSLDYKITDLVMAKSL